MVSNENFFLFSPLLHEVATGGVEPRHIAYPIRKSLRKLRHRDRFQFILANVEKINLNDQKVLTGIGALDFDYLILALGSIPDTSELNAEEGSAFNLKTLHDARLIKNHIIRIFEQANVQKDHERQKQLLTFTISGGGYIGIQLVTSLRDFTLKYLIRSYNYINPSNIRIILVEKEPKIISQLHTKLGAYAMNHLKQMGIEVRLKSQVTHVSRDHVEINNSEIIPTNTLIWAAGVTTNPKIQQLNVKKDNIGRVLVDEYLEIPGFPGAYAVGDCIHFKDPKSDQSIPAKAHTGVRQAKIAADNILADIRGYEKKQYIYSNPFEVVSLGSSKAIFSFGNLRIYGLPARFLWMMGYSLLATGTYNRIRIIMDWLLSLFFGRETTILK
jgi:NADH dehydrogenase